MPITLWIIVVEQFLRVSGIPCNLHLHRVRRDTRAAAVARRALRRLIDGLRDSMTARIRLGLTRSARLWSNWSL